MEPAEILERAADVIDERGHCTDGSASDGMGRVCALKAMSIAANGDIFVRDAAYRPFRAALGDIAVYAWNDSHSKNEVTAALRACAMTLRAQSNREPVRETVSEAA